MAAITLVRKNATYRDKHDIKLITDKSPAMVQSVVNAEGDEEDKQNEFWVKHGEKMQWIIGIGGIAIIGALIFAGMKTLKSAEA